MSTAVAEKPGQELSTEERDKLTSCEVLISCGLQTFVEVGSALLTISDERLYRATHSTFEDYCRARWNMTARRAYQLCEAGEVVTQLAKENVNNCSQTPLPKTESQARAVAKAPKQKRNKAMHRAAEIAG